VLKNHVEHLAISNVAGNTETRRTNRAIGGGVCRLVRDPGFVTTDAFYVGGGSVAAASLVPAVDPAAGGCPICTAHAEWVTAHTAHTPQGLLQQQELKEHEQQQRRELKEQQRELKEHEQQQRRELKEQDREQLTRAARGQRWRSMHRSGES
jgi:hypothetical protein